jgi:hypothetical protein
MMAIIQPMIPYVYVTTIPKIGVFAGRSILGKDEKGPKLFGLANAKARLFHENDKTSQAQRGTWQKEVQRFHVISRV